MSQKKYKKLIKHKLKLISSIDNKYLFLYFKQPNLIFDPSFVGIHLVLIEICPFEHEFQNSNLGQLQISGGRYRICQQNADKIFTFHLHFQLKWKRERRNNEFS